MRRQAANPGGKSRLRWRVDRKTESMLNEPREDVQEFSKDRFGTEQG